MLDTNARIIYFDRKLLGYFHARSIEVRLQEIRHLDTNARIAQRKARKQEDEKKEAKPMKHKRIFSICNCKINNHKSHEKCMHVFTLTLENDSEKKKKMTFHAIK